MAQSFACPSCGAPLDYDGSGRPSISCPYCFTSVIVPQEMRNQPAAPVSIETTQSLAGQATKLRELANLVRAGQKQQAAALYQQIYHVNPGDAEQLVNQLTGSGAVVISGNSMLTGATTVNVSTPYGDYTVNTGPTIGAYPANYSATSQITVNTAAQSRNVKIVMWIVFGFIAFSICITVVTTIIPLLIGLAAAFIPFLIR